MERDELVGHEITDVITGCLSQTAGGSPVLPRGPHRRRRTDVPVPSIGAETAVS
jgi:hypothetical protein